MNRAVFGPSTIEAPGARLARRNAVTIEFATSLNNPTFRIYRVAVGMADLSFLRDGRGPEQLVIFDGDEGQSTPLHQGTRVTLQKLSESGRRLATALFDLPLRGIYIAVDQVQLVAREPWTLRLHRGVTRALRAAVPERLETAEIPWGLMLSSA
jgi:hypothetical protein